MPKAKKASVKGKEKKPKRAYTPPVPPKGLKPLGHWTNKQGKKIAYYYKSFNPIANKVGPFVSGLYLMEPCKDTKEECVKKNVTPASRGIGAASKKAAPKKAAPKKATPKKASLSKEPLICTKVPPHFKAALVAFSKGAGTREFSKSGFAKFNEFHKLKFERDGSACFAKFFPITPANLLKIASIDWVQKNVTDTDLKALNITPTVKQLIESKEKQGAESGKRGTTAMDFLFNPKTGSLTKKPGKRKAEKEKKGPKAKKNKVEIPSPEEVLSFLGKEASSKEEVPSNPRIGRFRPLSLEPKDLFNAEYSYAEIESLGNRINDTIDLLNDFGIKVTQDRPKEVTTKNPDELYAIYESRIETVNGMREILNRELAKEEVRKRGTSKAAIKALQNLGYLITSPERVREREAKVVQVQQEVAKKEVELTLQKQKLAKNDQKLHEELKAARKQIVELQDRVSLLMRQEKKDVEQITAFQLRISKEEREWQEASNLFKRNETLLTEGFEKEKRDLQKQITELRNTIGKPENQQEVILKKQLQEQENEVAKLKKELLTVSSNYEKTANELLTAQTDLEESKASTQVLEAKKKALEVKLEKLAVQANFLPKESQNLEENIQELRHTYAEEIQKLKGEIKTKAFDTERLTNDLTSQKSNAEILQQELDRKTKRLKEVTEEAIEEKKKLLTAHHAELKIKEDLITKLRTSKMKWKKKAITNATSITDLRKALQLEIDTNTRTVAEYEKKVKELTAANIQLGVDLTKVKADLIRVTNELTLAKANQSVVTESQYQQLEQRLRLQELELTQDANRRHEMVLGQKETQLQTYLVHLNQEHHDAIQQQFQQNVQFFSRFAEWIRNEVRQREILSQQLLRAANLTWEALGQRDRIAYQQLHQIDQAIQDRFFNPGGDFYNPSSQLHLARIQDAAFHLPVQPIFSVTDIESTGLPPSLQIQYPIVQPIVSDIPSGLPPALQIEYPVQPSFIEVEPTNLPPSSKGKKKKEILRLPSGKKKSSRSSSQSFPSSTLPYPVSEPSFSSRTLPYPVSEPSSTLPYPVTELSSKYPNFDFTEDEVYEIVEAMNLLGVQIRENSRQWANAGVDIYSVTSNDNLFDNPKMQPVLKNLQKLFLLQFVSPKLSRKMADYLQTPEGQTYFREDWTQEISPELTF